MGPKSFQCFTEDVYPNEERSTVITVYYQDDEIVEMVDGHGVPWKLSDLSVRDRDTICTHLVQNLVADRSQAVDHAYESVHGREE